MNPAEADLSHMLASNPRGYYNYLKRARIRQKQGDCLGQAEDYRAAHLLVEHIDTAQNLVWLLATHPDPQCRDGKQALELLAGYGEVVEERYTDSAKSRFLATRAAVLAENGDYDAAKESAERAAALVASESREFAAVQRQLNAYNIKEPWRQTVR